MCRSCILHLTGSTVARQVLDVAAPCTYDCHCSSDSSCDTCSGAPTDKLRAEPCTGDTFTHDSTCGDGSPYILSNHSCWVKDDCSEIDLTSPHTHKTDGSVKTTIGAVVLSPCVFVYSLLGIFCGMS